MAFYRRGMRNRLALDAPTAGRRRARSAVAFRSPSIWHPIRRRALRETADCILRGGARVHPESALLVWRAAELTSARERRTCARSLRSIVKELDGKHLPGAVPLNRRGARPYEPVLAAIAERVGDLSQPVTPRSMVLVRDLLTDGESPLYCRPNVDKLPEALRRIQSALGEVA